MKALLLTLASLLLLSTFTFGQAAPTAPTTSLKVGDMAPDFDLPSTVGTKVKLSEFRGKNNVVLAFFVLAFTGG